GAVQAASSMASPTRRIRERRVAMWVSFPARRGGARSASSLAGPGVTQRDAAVEHRRPGGVVVAVGDEVAQALELERVLRRGPGPPGAASRESGWRWSW